jgi:hypothetical protein
MTNDTGQLPGPKSERRYTWPWYVLAAVLLAIVLAVLWMSKEIERIRRIRDSNAPGARTEGGAITFVAVAQQAVWQL